MALQNIFGELSLESTQLQILARLDEFIQLYVDGTFDIIGGTILSGSSSDNLSGGTILSGSNSNVMNGGTI